MVKEEVSKVVIEEGIKYFEENVKCDEVIVIEFGF